MTPTSTPQRISASKPQTQPVDTRGVSTPLGATVTADGVNFSVFSRHATGLDLLLFDHVEAGTPTRVVSCDPVANRSYHYWHVFVPNVKAGQIYGFRAHGPFVSEHPGYA